MPLTHQHFSKSCPYEKVSLSRGWFMDPLYLDIGYNAGQKTVQESVGFQLSVGRKPW